MNINRDFFIVGEPIETKYGEVRFLTYKEYLQNIGDINLISMKPLHVYWHYIERIEEEKLKKLITNEEEKKAKQDIAPLKKANLFEFVYANEEFMFAYIRLFKMVMNNVDSIDNVLTDEEAFMEFRNLIMEMNMIKEEKVTDNEMIQKFWNKSKKLKSKESGKMSFSDMVSSLVIGASLSYEQVFSMTVLQVYAAFYRLAAMKSYDTSTLFATVPSEKPPTIEDWAKNINLFETEKEGMDFKSFQKKFGSML